MLMKPMIVFNPHRFTSQFEHDVQAPTIDIYSNRGAGAVVEIDGWDYSTSTWINLWYASPTSTPMEVRELRLTPRCGFIFSNAFNTSLLTPRYATHSRLIGSTVR